MAQIWAEIFGKWNKEIKINEEAEHLVSVFTQRAKPSVQRMLDALRTIDIKKLKFQRKKSHKIVDKQKLSHIKTPT